MADLEAARSFSVAFIGYANKPGKREAFEQREASASIDRMTELRR